MRRTKITRQLNYDDPIEYLAPPHFEWAHYCLLSAPDYFKSASSSDLEKGKNRGDSQDNHDSKEGKQLQLPFDKEAADE